MTSIYDFSMKAIDGEAVSMNNFRGKVLLIVNVASQCRFTPQYAELVDIYNRMQDAGFVILGFPCNQFARQEPGDELRIRLFCSLHYAVRFPLFAKIDVNGPDTHPLFRHLKQESRGFLRTRAIKWNFTKFLVDRDGTVVRRFAPRTTPARIAPEIETLLARTH
jgi:glutathione peroxidase